MIFIVTSKKFNAFLTFPLPLTLFLNTTEYANFVSKSMHNFIIVLIYLGRSRNVFRTLPSIYEGAFCEISQWLKAMKYFHKKTSSY